MLEILDCFFDPDKKPVQPKPRFYPRRQRFNSKSKRGKDDRDRNGNRNSESSANQSKEIEYISDQLENNVKIEEQPKPDDTAVSEFLNSGVV